MDRIITITLCLFVIILMPFAGITGYTAYVETAYRTSITGNYTYACTITTDAPLYNVTFFLPVPADPAGNSPMVSALSSRTMEGLPDAWEPTLFDTGKATMLKLTAPAILPPAGTPAPGPFTVTFSSASSLRSAIVTADPVASGVMFRPVQALVSSTCPPAYQDAQCSSYTTSLYADYDTAPDTTVTIVSSVSGENRWKIFEPRSNEYHTGISLTMKGEQHGWTIAPGTLAAGIGSYDAPVVS